MDECKSLPRASSISFISPFASAHRPCRQELTLVPVSSQLEHFVLERGSMQGVFRGC